MSIGIKAAACGLAMSGALSFTLAFAQAPSAPAQTAPAAADTEEFESMAEPMLGDRWTYQVRDEVTKTIKGLRSHEIADMKRDEISIRIKTIGTGGTNYIAYDRDWNVRKHWEWTYTPDDGSGIKQPLKAGANWKIQGDYVGSATTRGATYKRTGSTKVSEESVTTRAGTFNAFKVESIVSDRAGNDPTKKIDATTVSWYVPALNHWAKRTTLIKRDGKVIENFTEELVEFGRQ